MLETQRHTPIPTRATHPSSWVHHAHSKVHLFPITYNSRCISQFAMFFIVSWTKTFTTTYILTNSCWPQRGRVPRRMQKNDSFSHVIDPPSIQDSHSLVCSSNDPSAGSPTETLLRLLLPLSNMVCSTSCPAHSNCPQCHPKDSPDNSIGRSDGRCVQRAGT